jgi:multidrug efflux pump subunit AcrA (membrane-fusion protein)
MPSLSYIEVMELSYFGAKVMHPRSIEPAMRKNILVRVKNTFNPSHPGTVILRNGQRDNRVVKALTYIDKVAAININGAQMIGRPGVAKAIFTILADHEVNVMMISQGSSEANISLIVDEAHLNAAVHALADLVIEGRITAINAVVDAATRNIQVQGTVANSKKLLFPGMFVSVAVVLPSRDNVLVIPTPAVLYAAYSDSVFIVEEKKSEKDGRPLKTVRQQFVKLGEKRGDFVSVVSGLKEGETVAQDGAGFLTNGAAVTVKEAQKSGVTGGNPRGTGDTVKGAPGAKPEAK